MGSKENYDRYEQLDIVGENCLLMDIWRPVKHYSTKLPIGIWIHGGGLYTGNADRMIGSHIVKTTFL